MRPASRAAVFAATVASLFCTGAASAYAVAQPMAPDAKTATSANSFDNSLIAKTALGYVGRWGGQACLDADHAAFGQCKQFVNCVVSLASGGRLYPVDPNGDYQASFADVGGVEVKAANAVTGDIIQIGDHDNSPILHTAIVLVNHHNGGFTVVDANWVGQPQIQEMVGVHDWTPPAGARFWRVGTAKPVLPSDLTKMIENVTNQVPTAVPAAPKLAVADPTGVGFVSGTLSLSTATSAAGSTATAERVWVDGKEYDTYGVASVNPTFALDTTGLTDGTHHLRAQAITAFGAVSKLGPALTIKVVNKAAAVGVLPSDGLASGTVTLGAVTSPPAAKDVLSVSVDGAPPTQPGLQFDTSDLAVGQHTVAITATGADGKVAATSAPVTITVGPATSQRVAIDINGSGRSDLVALDSSGHVVRYTMTDDGVFGQAQVIDPATPHGTVRLLAAGHFATADAPAQLLAVWSDGSAHLYDFNVDGTLGHDTLIGGDVPWASVSTLTVRDDGQLIAQAQDGSTSAVTFALLPDAAPQAAPGTDAAAADGTAAGADGANGTSPSSAPSAPASAPSGTPSVSATPSATSAATGDAPKAKGSTGHAADAKAPATPDPTSGSGSASGPAASTATPSADPSGSAADAAAAAGPDAVGATTDGTVVPDPATVPGVLAVAVPLTPPTPAPSSTPDSKSAPAKTDSKKDSKTGAKADATKAQAPAEPAAPTVPATPGKTPVSTLTGHFTSDGVLEILTTYSDGTSDLRPAAQVEADAATQPIAVIFTTVAAVLPDVSRLDHLAGLLDQ